MSYLLDTDICSAQLRGDRRLAGRFMQYFGRLHVSTITAGELYAWAGRAGVSAGLPKKIDDFLGSIIPLDFTDPVARTFGTLRADLLDIGRPAPALDLLIAATALHHGLTLATRNVRDYANVPGLTTEDWLAP